MLFIVNCILWNEHSVILIQNSKLFRQENASANIICEMVTISPGEDELRENCNKLSHPKHCPDSYEIVLCGRALLMHSIFFLVDLCHIKQVDPDGIYLNSFR